VGVTTTIDCTRDDEAMREPLVLLHGFTQTGRAWDGVVAALRVRDDDVQAIAPDLRGHGSAADRRPIDTPSLVDDVLALASRPFVLAGYSMGGRLALHVALAAPGRVRRLVLVSTTAGLKDPQRSAQRRASDEALADELERDGIEAFARRWGDLPLWDGQPADVRARAHAERLTQDPAGLAASLRGFGTAHMEPVWDRLGELRVPVTIVVGARDERFRATARRLQRRMPWSQIVVVAGAGHALPLEAPGPIARAIAG
jgi:2-succinyl-6-hydroxy-2,4-cyclohexadiene-1-carboxylate synthase